MSMSLAVAAHQPVAHPAADDERAAARVAHGLGDVSRTFERVVCHPITLTAEIAELAEIRIILCALSGLCGDRSAGSSAGLRPYFLTIRSQNPGASAFSQTRPRDMRVRIDLGHRTVDRPGDRVGDLCRRSDAGQRSRVTGAPVSRDITSKNSVSVETGKTTLT